MIVLLNAGKVKLKTTQHEQVLFRTMMREGYHTRAHEIDQIKEK